MRSFILPNRSILQLQMPGYKFKLLVRSTLQLPVFKNIYVFRVLKLQCHRNPDSSPLFPQPNRTVPLLTRLYGVSRSAAVQQSEFLHATCCKVVVVVSSSRFVVSVGKCKVCLSSRPPSVPRSLPNICGLAVIILRRRRRH